MTKYTGYFDAVEGSPNYDSGEYAKVANMQFDGVAPGYENELEVSQGTGLQVTVDSGGIMSKGRYFINDEPANGTSPETLAVDAAATGYLRKDRVVVEFDVENAAAQLKIVKGTEAASDPALPDLGDTDSLWEAPLAIVNIEGGSITSVEDDRTIYGARTKTSTPYCMVKRGTSNQTSGNNVEFETAVTDTDGIWNASNPDRLTVPEDGDYLITYDVAFTTTLTGYNQTSVNINGIGQLLTRAYCNGSNALLKGAHVFRMSAGDYATLPSPISLDASNYVRSLEVNASIKKIS